MSKDNCIKKIHASLRRKSKHGKRKKKFERDLDARNLGRKPLKIKADPFLTQCWFCSVKFEYTSILKHVSNTKLCKEFYGPKFEEIQRRHSNIRKQIYREKHGREAEYLKEREKYNSDKIIREKKHLQSQKNYQTRKEEFRLLEIKEKEDTFRKNAIKSVEYDAERFKLHHSGCSYGKNFTKIFTPN